MSTLTPTKVVPREQLPARGRRRSRIMALVLALSGVVVAVTLGLVVWLGGAGSEGLPVEAGFSRGQLAEIARLEGQAAMYQQQARERGYAADAARWAAQAEFYERARQARANEAATARLQGLADRHAE